MSTHIDQMNAWWDEAAPGIPKMGDTYIEDERHRGSSFRIVEAATDHKYGFENIRILHRAPAPKPAWHNAVAVIANHRDCVVEPRTVWTRESDPEGHDWSDAHTAMAAPHHLVNVTPLIEAKVTDEMVLRALNASTGLDLPHHTSYKRDEVEVMRIALLTALNLDPA